MKKYVIGISLMFLVFLVFKQYREKASIRRNLNITSAHIQEVSTGYRGGLQLEYTFPHNGKKYKSATKIFISSSFANRFIDKRIPLAFDSLQPENNELLLLPASFVEYDLAFPDTLNWVVELQSKSL